MERMTGLDASFLYLETPEQAMVINGVVTVDVTTMSGGYSFERLRAELARRVKEIPQFRRKVYDSPLNVGHPAWVEEYDLDIDAHFHKVVLDVRRDEHAIADLCGEFASRPMDRSRPLWEAWVIEDPENPGEVTIFCRAHHAILDGMSGAQMLGMLAGTDSSHPAQDVDLIRTQAGGRNAVQLVAGGLWDVATRPLRFARLLPETLGIPLRMRKGSGGATSSEAMPAPFTAPRTRFNATITPHRAFATVSVGLDDLRAVKDAFGVTLNDVLLTIVAGGLRRYLEHYDELPEKPLVAIVPTSTRSDADVKGANQVSAMFASLGTDVADPVERLHAIASRTRRGKSQSGALRPQLLADWAALSPAALVNAGMRMYGAFKLADVHPVIYNLVVSNVPGPRHPIYFLGARVTHMYPTGPIFHGAGMSVTVLSLDGHLDMGVISCEHLVPDPQRFADGIRDAMDELTAASTGR